MAFITADDGVKLYYEETGSGTPIVFVHEFAGDVRSWEPQVRRFSRHYRCIAYNARGYPPSDVPAAESYSQERARDDIRCVLDELGIEKAHVVGLSMGGFATLHFGMSYPQRAHSLVIAGCGYGAAPAHRRQFMDEAEAAAARFEQLGMAKAAEDYGVTATRVQFQNKDPRGWREFVSQLGGHSTEGAARTMRGVQKRRPSLYDLVERMSAISAPTLIVAGDEDWQCLEPGLLMKRAIPAAGLAVLPNTGHTVNLEEPDAFNRLLTEFFHSVALGTWPLRDPRAMAATILGR